MIVITGASDGLGLELAKICKDDGYTVVNISRTVCSVADVNIACDLTDSEQIVAAVEDVLQIDEKMSALVNSAAIVSYEDIDNLSAQELEKMFKVNVTGMMQLTSGLLSKIKGDQADILNVGATIALRAGGAQQAVYSTVKWAVRGFTENLQAELKNTKCRVTNFLVGGFQSRLHEKVTARPLENPSDWMPASDVAKCIKQVLDSPKTMEISEIIVNRKTNT
jgi:short-subunit dehydrogenase